jgi:hypothetical protein
MLPLSTARNKPRIHAAPYSTRGPDVEARKAEAHVTLAENAASYAPSARRQPVPQDAAGVLPTS